MITIEKELKEKNKNILIFFQCAIFFQSYYMITILFRFIRSRFSSFKFSIAKIIHLSLKSYKI